MSPSFFLLTLLTLAYLPKSRGSLNFLSFKSPFKVSHSNTKEMSVGNRFLQHGNISPSQITAEKLFCTAGMAKTAESGLQGFLYVGFIGVHFVRSTAGLG